MRNGKVDVRALLLETPEDKWRTTNPRGEIDDPLVLMLRLASLGDSWHLPGDGYFLN